MALDPWWLRLGRAVAALAGSLAVATTLGYLADDVRRGLVVGAVVGSIFAAFILLGLL